MIKDENKSDPSGTKSLEDYFKEINLFYRNATSRKNNESSTSGFVPPDAVQPDIVPEPPQMIKPAIPVKEKPDVPTKSEKPSKKSAVTPAEEYEKFKKENPFTGSLKIQTFVGRNVYPVANANVVVSKDFESGKHIIYSSKTDMSGLTKEIILPATPSSETDSPQRKVEPITYQVEVSHPSYVTLLFKNVPIFQDVKSIQKAYMILKSVSPNPNQTIIIDEKDKYNI